jgi:hypothetical protein
MECPNCLETPILNPRTIEPIVMDVPCGNVDGNVDGGGRGEKFFAPTFAILSVN